MIDIKWPNLNQSYTLSEKDKNAPNLSEINKDDLGWKPSVEFDEGLRNTVKWYLQNIDWLCRKNK